MRIMVIILLAGAAAACGETKQAEAPAGGAGNVAPTTNQSAAAPEPAPPAPPAGPIAAPSQVAPPQEEREDRSGPTRNATCEINEDPPAPCAFTPVLGDGSFDIDMPDRQLRIVVSGDEAVAFDRIGTRRIPLPGTLRRDSRDTACWLADLSGPDAMLSRVCAR